MWKMQLAGVILIVTACALLAATPCGPGGNCRRKAAVQLALAEFMRQSGQMDAFTNVEAAEIRAGYDIRDFAQKGDELWQVEFSRGDRSLAVPAKVGILWVNLDSREVLAISAPWVSGMARSSGMGAAPALGVNGRGRFPMWPEPGSLMRRSRGRGETGGPTVSAAG